VSIHTAPSDLPMMYFCLITVQLISLLFSVFAHGSGRFSCSSALHCGYRRRYKLPDADSRRNVCRLSGGVAAAARPKSAACSELEAPFSATSFNPEWPFPTTDTPRRVTVLYIVYGSWCYLTSNSSLFYRVCSIAYSLSRACSYELTRCEPPKRGIGWSGWT
jgi:hypothetical protein